MLTTSSASTINKFFKESETYSKDQVVTRAYILDGKSGCCLFEFDGVGTIFNVYTPPKYRNQGYATELLKQVVVANPEIMLLARSIDDSVIKIFKQAGFYHVFTNSKLHKIVSTGTE